jgi:Tol biopolymer transport system component
VLQPGTVLDNKYCIEATLGRGGFGHVYRAQEQLTGETVAIKELIPALVGDPQMVQRFIQEARATLRLTHSSIARTYNIFRDGGTYYLAMEYLPGGSLADRLKEGALPLEEALRIISDLCAALSYAHRQGVVHCDIKPANVLFNARGEVHLADFGIAHVSETMMTRQMYTGTGTVIGTMRYMAPEQLEGVRDDARVDIYALGALLYEMLAGRPYLDFETETTPAAQMRNLHRIQSESPRPIRTVNPTIPEWLAMVLERTLAKSPEDRFPTAEALQQALVPRLPGVDIEPPPPQLQLVLPDGHGVPLTEGTLTLGRDPGCEVVMADSQVSRRHAILHVRADSTRIVDLGSTNGTYLNDQRLKPRSPQPLQAGDRVRLGGTLTFQVQAQSARPLTATPQHAEEHPPPSLPPTQMRATREPPRRGSGQRQRAVLIGLGIAAVVIIGSLAAVLLVQEPPIPEPYETIQSMVARTNPPAPTDRAVSLPTSSPVPEVTLPPPTTTPQPTPYPPTATPTTVPSDTPVPTPTPVGGGSGRIAFARVAADTNRNGKLDWSDVAEIFAMGSDGSGEQQLTYDGAFAWSPAWSPDGSQIAYHSDRDGDAEIYVIASDGSNRRQLTSNNHDDGGASWAPDGSRIAFHSDRHGNKEIYVMWPDGSGATRLTNHPGEDRYPAWSPDGATIAFDSSRDGDREIYVMNYDGSGQTPVTQNATDDWWPTWSPDSRRIAYMSGSGSQARICIVDVYDRQVNCVTSASDNAASPAWSPDGNWIAFVLWETPKNCEVFLMDPSGRHQTRLTHHTGLDSRPAWAP